MGITPGQGVGGLLSSLWAHGEDGFLFYPMSDLTRLFLLSTGLTGNAAADTDPVGLDLDNHSWGNGVSLTAILAAATELFTPGTSVDASVPSGTSSESPPGTITVTGDGTNQGRRDLSVTTVVGKTYVLRADISVGQAVVSIGTSQGGTQIVGNAIFANAGASGRYYFVATSTTTWVRFLRTVASSSVAANVSVKLVPGNHALQATTTKRPLYKTNSGKPYLLFDGTDDFLQTPSAPIATGTVAVAFQSSAFNSIAIGGGGGTGNKRLRLGLGSSGQPRLVFNDVTDINMNAVNRVNTNVLLAVTWDATGWAAYLDGVLTQSAATVPNMDGLTESSFCIGSLEAGASSFNNGPVYAVLHRNARSTPAEMALITSKFQGAYQ